MKFHPDRNPGDTVAEERFKELSEAYAMLSDPDKRARYDRFGFLGDVSAFTGADVSRATDFFDAIFGDLFGLARRKSAAGRDLRYTLEIDFEEAALGCRKTISFERAEDCGACRGSGAEGGAGGLIRCPRCGGEGYVRKKAGFLAGRRECLGCGGAGEVPKVPCGACQGAGLVDRTREFEVRVPPGSTNGSVQRVAGEGSPGRRGGVSGDLHVIVRVRPHPFYAREGDTLSIEVPISMAEAALGADVEVPVLDGIVRMKVPPGTQSGSVFRVRGKGIPRPGGGRGDAHVRVVVETPTAVGRDAGALLARLDELLGAAATPRRREFVEAVRRQAASAPRGGDDSEGTTAQPGEPLRGEAERSSRAPREPS